MNLPYDKDQMPSAAAQLDEQAKARVAAAWAELVEAAKNEPKARAFLDAFGCIATAHGLPTGVPDSGEPG